MRTFLSCIILFMLAESCWAQVDDLNELVGRTVDIKTKKQFLIDVEVVEVKPGKVEGGILSLKVRTLSLIHI